MSGLLSAINRTVGPVMLMIYSPNMVIFMWYAAVHCDGSFNGLFRWILGKGAVPGVVDILSNVSLSTPAVLFAIFGYMLFALILQASMPGHKAAGPVTPKGNVSVKKDNCYLCFLVTIATFVGLSVYLKQHGLTSIIVYDRFDEVLVTLTLFSLRLDVLIIRF